MQRIALVVTGRKLEPVYAKQSFNGVHQIL